MVNGQPTLEQTIYLRYRHFFPDNHKMDANMIVMQIPYNMIQTIVMDCLKIQNNNRLKTAWDNAISSNLKVNSNLKWSWVASTSKETLHEENETLE